MRAHVFAVLCAALLVQACDSAAGRTFRLPTAPEGPTAAPPATTRPPLADDYTPLALGQRFFGRVPANPPECIGFRGWPCQYFRLTAPSTGILIVDLTYQTSQQPRGQGVDVSVETPHGEFWADGFSSGAVQARGAVREGEVLQLVLWYTFSGLEYELTTTLRSE